MFQLQMEKSLKKNHHILYRWWLCIWPKSCMFMLRYNGGVFMSRSYKKTPVLKDSNTSKKQVKEWQIRL